MLRFDQVWLRFDFYMLRVGLYFSMYEMTWVRFDLIPSFYSRYKSLIPKGRGIYLALDRIIPADGTNGLKFDWLNHITKTGFWGGFKEGDQRHGCFTMFTSFEMTFLPNYFFHKFLSHKCICMMHKNVFRTMHALDFMGVTVCKRDLEYSSAS